MAVTYAVISVITTRIFARVVELRLFTANPNVTHVQTSNTKYLKCTVRGRGRTCRPLGQAESSMSHS